MVSKHNHKSRFTFHGMRTNPINTLAQNHRLLYRLEVKLHLNKSKSSEAKVSLYLYYYPKLHSSLAPIRTTFSRIILENSECGVWGQGFITQAQVKCIMSEVRRSWSSVCVSPSFASWPPWLDAETMPASHLNLVYTHPRGKVMRISTIGYFERLARKSLSLKICISIGEDLWHFLFLIWLNFLFCSVTQTQKSTVYFH